MALASRTFRIFVSSTFSDLIEERNSLQERVFPKLRRMCIEHGFRFQAIDLRWGVSEQASLSHETMRICLKEIKRCQSVTPRPNFIVLLGDRYGWEPVPEEIPSDEFNDIINTIKNNQQDFSDKAIPLIQKWYKEDRNAVPSVYLLQPVDPEEYPKGTWEQQVQTPLLNVFRKSVEKLDFSEEQKLKYVASATHQEVVNGAMNVEDAHEHVFGFFKDIENLNDLKEKLSDNRVNEFLDTDSEGNFNESAHTKLTSIKKSLQNKLGHNNIFNYDVRWENDHITTDHLDQFCEDVNNSLSKVIKDEAKKVKEIDDMEKEIDDHIAFGIDRSRFFVGRVKILDDIEQYMRSSNNHPMVIYGESGTGKSALMAKASEEILNEFPTAAHIIRFIGATPPSSNIQSLLKSICEQIYKIFNYEQQKKQRLSENRQKKLKNLSKVKRKDVDAKCKRDEIIMEARRKHDEIIEEYTIPEEIEKLTKTFFDFLFKVPKEKKLIIFLDALDQLSDNYNAKNLNWLPHELPENMKIIASTISILPHDSQEKCFQILKDKLPEDNLCELKSMHPEEGEKLLDLWFDNINRTLQFGQQQEVLGNFKKNGKPLYLKLAFEEAKRWKSYLKKEETNLSADISGIIQDLFKRLSLEQNHGEMMVSRSLGYIAAGKNGISEDELIDVLSSDEEVIQDFLRRSPKSPKVDRLPVIVWSRLYFDLEPYIIEITADGTSLMTFYHPTTFGNQVEEEYLSGETKINRHKQLAQYFEKQDLYIDEEEQKTQNLRKLSELPFQQTRAKMWNEVTGTLCDLNFIQAKCAAKLTYELVKDFNIALDELRLAQAEQRGESKIQKRMKKYIEDLIAYAKGEIKSLDIPKSEKPWSKKKITSEKKRLINNPNLIDRMNTFSNFLGIEANNLQSYAHEFNDFAYQQAWNYADSGPIGKEAEKISSQRKKYLLLKPQKLRSLYNPLPEVIKTLSDYPRGWCNAMSVTPDGRIAVFGSKDNTLKVCDMKTGEVIHTLKGHKDTVWDVSVTPDGRIAVSGSSDSSDKNLIVWDLKTGKELNTLKGHKDTVWALDVTPDGQLAISSSSDGKLIVWDLKTTEIIKTLKGHRGSVPAVSMTPNGQLAVSGSEDGTLIVWDLEKGEKIKTIKGHTESITDVIVTPDGRIAVSNSKDQNAKIWNLKKGKECKRLKQKYVEIDCISITPDGKLLVSGSYDETLKLWDLKRGKELKTFKGHRSAVIAVCITADGQLAISGSDEDGTLIIWDLIKTGKRIKRKKGHIKTLEGPNQEKVRITPDGRLAISGSDDGTLSVWDLKTGDVLKTIEGHDESVNTVGVTPDSKHAVSGSSDCSLKVWDLETGDRQISLIGHEDVVNVVSVLPDGRLAVSISDDENLNIWDLEQVKPIKTIKNNYPNQSLTVTPDGKLAVVDLVVLNLKTGNRVKKLEGNKESIEAIHVTPDGRYVVSCSREGTLNIWDLKTGKQIKIIDVNNEEITDFSISSDGRRIVSSSWDNTLKVWDLVSGKKLAQFISLYPLHSVDMSSNIIFASQLGGNNIALHSTKSLLCPSPGFTTVCRHWDFKLKKFSPFSVYCPFCGYRHEIEKTSVDSIKAILLNANLSSNQSPCISLPNEAWDDPKLLSACPKCKEEIRFNPFIVDNSDIDENL